MFDYDGLDEIIVIVGGAGGIGSSIVSTYFEKTEGEIIIGDIDEKHSKEIVDLYGDRVFSYPVDVLKYDSIVSFKDVIEQRFGHVTHLVSLAGGSLKDEFCELKDIGESVIGESVDLNLTSHLYLMKQFIPLMEKDKHEDKTITLISSVNAIKNYAAPAYSSAKAGLIGTVSSTVNQLGRNNIRVNAVLPGTVLIPPVLKNDVELDMLAEESALGRLSTPDEIANVLYALSHIMTCVTGESIVADCGQTKTTLYSRSR